METTNENRFDRKQAAEYLGVSVITVDRAIANKTISFFRIGRRVLFDLRHLEAFLSRNEVAARK
jgi:excisionase family DNA binding protein